MIFVELFERVLETDLLKEYSVIFISKLYLIHLDEVNVIPIMCFGRHGELDRSGASYSVVSTKGFIAE